MATDETRLLVRIEAQLRQFERAMQQASGSADKTAGRIERRFSTMERKLSGVGGSLGRLLAVAITGQTIRKVAEYADEWTTAGNKIAAASQIAGRAGRSLSDINKIAISTRSGLTETADLYAKLLRSTADVADSEEDVARATELVNKAFKAGGAATSEQAAGILQLSQALGSGILQGDELRSIRENAPLVAQAIAKEFKTTVAGLKALGQEGKLTSDRVFKAILAGAPQIEAAFARTTGTIGDAFTNFRNRLTESIGKINDEFGASHNITTLIYDIGTALSTVTDFIIAMHQPLAELGAFLNVIANAIDDLGDAAKNLPNPFSAKGVGGAQAQPPRIFDSQGNLLFEGTTPKQPKKPATQMSANDRIRRAFNTGLENAGDADLARILRERVPPPPLVPHAGGVGGAGTTGHHKKTPAEHFAEDLARVRDRIALLNTETAAVGKSTLVAEKARVTQELLNEAKRAGLEITPKIRAEIDAEAEAYAHAADVLEKTQQRFDAINEIASDFGGGLIDTIEGLADGTSNLNDILADTAKAIRHAALEAILLGNGPLAQLLGLGGVGGGVGGLFGKIIGGFGGGGPTAALAGVGAMPTPMAAFQGQRNGRVEHVVRIAPSPLFVTTMESSSQQAENRAVGRAPAVARNNSRRFGTP